MEKLVGPTNFHRLLYPKLEFIISVFFRGNLGAVSEDVSARFYQNIKKI